MSQISCPKDETPTAVLRGRIEAIVLHNPVVSHQVLANEVDQLRLGVTPVGAQRLEQSDILRADAGREQNGQHFGQEDSVGG